MSDLLERATETTDAPRMAPPKAWRIRWRAAETARYEAGCIVELGDTFVTPCRPVDRYWPAYPSLEIAHEFVAWAAAENRRRGYEPDIVVDIFPVEAA